MKDKLINKIKNIPYLEDSLWEYYSRQTNDKSEEELKQMYKDITADMPIEDLISMGYRKVKQFYFKPFGSSLFRFQPKINRLDQLFNGKDKQQLCWSSIELCNKKEHIMWFEREKSNTNVGNQGDDHSFITKEEYLILNL